MDRANPAEKHVMVMANKYGIASAPITPQMFASAGMEHMEKYGTNGIAVQFPPQAQVSSQSLHSLSHTFPPQLH